MLLFSQLRRDLHWQAAHGYQHRIDANTYQWLTDHRSLTKKLIKKSDGKFRVTLIQQRIQAIRLSERRALKLPSRQWAVVREVVLCGADTAWVYARTVIPLNTLRGPLRRLHYLGNKPLGGQLFANPTMRRGPVSITHFKPRDLPHSLHGQEGACWGRRSVFTLSKKSLLVAEVLLPALLSSP